MKTARFWHYHKSGAVKIKLRPGQTVHHSHGGRTDEGWHRESNAFQFDGRTVTVEWCNDGADCDGRLTRSGISHCAADRLTAGYHDTETGESFPDWQEGESSQRDYAAEAAGY
ncbi:hypothetical protein ABIF65_003718 [Bradyrhizobium japonicum]|jgi:hypothetical protein|uniref:hypothetical protein n=1 Tax=Bradyrhizobium TaxID=374 RepID=UPI0004BC53D5|nr:MULTISPECIES: hypothetical protein [Bradyrhizobium]MBR0998800.1 hypothetical protein [Bradyrhizobium liaoningense]MBR1066865.1 hypothetical protein [Bradyrhizobium liaoningense]MDI2074502.1 hypothetical protein [Bradyrhizobium sp. Mp27]